MSVVLEKGYRTKLHWINETTEGTPPSGGTPLPQYKTFYAFVDLRISRPEQVQPTIDDRDYSFIELGYKTYDASITYFPHNIELLQESITNVTTNTQTYSLNSLCGISSNATEVSVHPRIFLLRRFLSIPFVGFLRMQPACRCL